MSEISSNKQNANNKRKLQKKVNSMTNKKKKRNTRHENYLSNKLDNIEKFFDLKYTNLESFKPQLHKAVN